MNIYPSVPPHVTFVWNPSIERHPPKEVVGYHYHDVEEWLEVVKGDVTFLTLSDQPFRVGVGLVLRIPRGEVHRVEIGPEGAEYRRGDADVRVYTDWLVEIGSGGVEYRRWLPVPPDGSFANNLTSREVDLLKENLAFPTKENNVDGDAPEYFEKVLSDHLAFVRADGTVVDKNQFLASGFTDRGRRSSGTVQVLNRTQNGILLSTVVTVNETDEPPRSFTNVRHFVSEDSGARCRLWVNYPELAP